MEIVSMTKEHTAQLAELERLCFSRPWSQAALEEELTNPSAVFLVAREENRILGYAGMHCAFEECYVDNVAVFPEFRRRGAASALIGALEEAAKTRGGEFLSLEVRPSNEGAVALYMKLGFREEGRRRGFYSDPLEDGLILTKRWENGKKTYRDSEEQSAIGKGFYADIGN